MSKVGVRLKLDVSKIDKELLFKGAKGTYLDATVFIDDEQDQYGNNGMVTQDVSQEARQAGTKGPIIGNVKVFWRDENQGASQANQAQNPMPVKQNEFAASDDIQDEDIPF